MGRLLSTAVDACKPGQDVEFLAARPADCRWLFHGTVGAALAECAED
jgi:hypothetical protein